MINIENDVTERLQNRLNMLWRHYHGKSGTKINSLDHFINKILIDYLDRKDNEDRNPKINGGIPWLLFRKRHFNEIYLRDRGRCKYCTERIHRDKATLDHIIPPLRGGLNELDNLAVACSWCNRDKGILTDEEYYYKQLVNAAKGIKPPRESI